MLKTITFTGVDAATNLSRLTQLSMDFPMVEWGFLYSPKRQGQPGRYPSIEFLQCAFKNLPSFVNVSLHICGRGMIELLEPMDSTLKELLHLIGKRAGRVQLNFNAQECQFKIEDLVKVVKEHPAIEFITQHNEANKNVWTHFQGLSNFSILFDGSGGRGISPTEWQSPFLDGRFFGYAGGLGPDNVLKQVLAIQQKCTTADRDYPFWIDMENKVRDENDWFDLDKVQQVLNTLSSPKIYPVIHYLNKKVALEEAAKAVNAGVDGVFMISHGQSDADMLDAAHAVKLQYPRLQVGVNSLSMDSVAAVTEAAKGRFPFVWCDDAGVNSKGFTIDGQITQLRCKRENLKMFASVAFKYQPDEPNPALAAKYALDAGFIPTTSGSGTGSAPTLEKIIAMSKAANGTLAVASGITPENVARYAPYVSHILVATGIAQDSYRMDLSKLKTLIANANVLAMPEKAEPDWIDQFALECTPAGQFCNFDYRKFAAAVQRKCYWAGY